MANLALWEILVWKANEEKLEVLDPLVFLVEK